MEAQRGFLVSLVLNVGWTAFWVPYLLYRQYWYPQAPEFIFWALTLLIPGLITGLTFRTYFYQRFQRKDVLTITALWSVSTLASGIGPLVIGVIYARHGLNTSFDRQRGLLLAVMAAVFYGLLWFVQIMMIYPLHVLSVDALPRVIQIGIGLGALNAVALHFLLILAERLGSPKLPVPVPAEVSESTAAG